MTERHCALCTPDATLRPAGHLTGGTSILQCTQCRRVDTQERWEDRRRPTTRDKGER